MISTAILPVKDSIVITVIWCFLTFKTAAILFWYAKKYAEFVYDERENLVETNQRQEPESA